MLEGTESGTDLKRLPTPINLYEDECAFCHSFRTSQFHGPMVLYLKGRIFSIDESKPSNGIYVHRNCLEWAPQVWFESDVVVNLEPEIRRASRLRCHRCGLPGAALGCYYKTCRKTFHVPCTLQIHGCHWDVDDKLVLCPEHVSKALPCDKLISQKNRRERFPSLPQSQCSHKEESFTTFQGGQQIDQLHTQSSFLPSCFYNCVLCLRNFYDYRGQTQQTNHLSASNSSSLTQSHCSHKEAVSTCSSREGQQTDQLTTSSSSLQMCHSDEGISNTCQGKEMKGDRQGTSSYPSDKWVLLSSSISASEKETQSNKEGPYNDHHEKDDKQIDELSTTKPSSCPQGHHPGKGISVAACQRDEIKTNQSDASLGQLVLLGSSLSASEKDSLEEFADWIKARITNEWAKNVTHVIVGKNAGSAWSRSYEVLMAILSGKWVVEAKWMVDCLDMCPDHEDLYEVTFSDDSHRPLDGPKKGRTRAAEGAPKLFSGLLFYLSAYLNPGDRVRIRDLIAAAGGRVLYGISSLHLQPPAKPYFVYDGGASGEVSTRSLWMEVEEARKYAAAGARVISHLRVMDAVAAYDAEVLDQKGCFALTLLCPGFMPVVSW